MQPVLKELMSVKGLILLIALVALGLSITAVVGGGCGSSFASVCGSGCVGKVGDTCWDDRECGKCGFGINPDIGCTEQCNCGGAGGGSGIPGEGQC